jgi:ATP-dependent Clp protease adaptor protein ClpS
MKKFTINNNQSDESNDDTVLLQPARPKLKQPPLYKVILLNDDYTPMEFVVHVLEAIFNHNREEATRIMLNVHKSGKGICGIFTKDIAETKVTQVNSYARENKHPLLCDMEEQ